MTITWKITIKLRIFWYWILRFQLKKIMISSRDYDCFQTYKTRSYLKFLAKPFYGNTSGFFVLSSDSLKNNSLTFFFFNVSITWIILCFLIHLFFFLKYSSLSNRGVYFEHKSLPMTVTITIVWQCSKGIQEEQKGLCRRRRFCNVKGSGESVVNNVTHVFLRSLNTISYNTMLALWWTFLKASVFSIVVAKGPIVHLWLWTGGYGYELANSKT